MRLPHPPLTTFGEIAAEADFRPDFFVPSTSWARVRDRQHPVVIGRKGTGKTALRLALRNEARGDPLQFASDLAFRDYPWNVHNSVYDDSVGGRSRYLETWLFLMLIELSKLVAGENQGEWGGEEAREHRDSLRLFIEENWGTVTFDHRDIFRAESYQVTSTLQPQVGGSGVGSVNWTRTSRQRLGDSLSAMNRWLKQTLIRCLQLDATYFLIFDELDLDFDQRDDVYNDSMIGLLLAAQNFYTWAREEEVPAMPVVLLRDDIYGQLRFPDKNKISLGLVETLHWEPSLAGPNSLKTLMDTRIRVLLDLELDLDDPWYVVFDEDVMRGTQHKYRHMVERTYLRPRDLIQFGNACLDSAAERLQNDPSGHQRISNDDVTAARTTYSNYLRAELADEIHAHYPDWERWLELLRRAETLTFSRDRFDEVCGESEEILDAASATDVLGAFYQFGVIGFGRRGGRGKGGTDEYWSFRNPDVTFDAKAPFFKVHPGLKENLDLKEERR